MSIVIPKNRAKESDTNRMVSNVVVVAAAVMMVVDQCLLSKIVDCNCRNYLQPISVAALIDEDIDGDVVVVVVAHYTTLFDSSDEAYWSLIERSVLSLLLVSVVNHSVVGYWDVSEQQLSVVIVDDVSYQNNHQKSVSVDSN